MGEHTDRLQLPKGGGVAPRDVPICGPSRNECLISPASAQAIACWTLQPERGSRL
jgi:hypothetical protein